MSSPELSFDVKIVRTATCTTTGTVHASSEEEARELASINDLTGQAVNVQHSKVLTVKVEEACAELKGDQVSAVNSKRFRLKFERYAQEAAFVDVQADCLRDALSHASEIDTSELDWEIEDTDPTCPRLYGVQDESELWVATVDLKGLFGAPTWFSEDLRSY